MRFKIQEEFEKKEQQIKRKYKLDLQQKETEMQENFHKNFDDEVRKKSAAILEKRELDIQRKYRIQYQKQVNKYEQEMKEKHE